MRFVISVWNEFANDFDFENTIPLEFNGRRLAQLGERNRIDVLVLRGYDGFSESYRGRLRELGYVLHDCQALTHELAARFPTFADSYRNWGGIKHFGLLRFLVIPRFFPNEDIISIDADNIFNAGFAEIEAAIGGELYFVGRSTSLCSIPSRSGFFDVFETHLLRAHDNPERYARKEMLLENADGFLDPNRFGGTDQGFVRHLHSRGLIRIRDDTLLAGNLIGINSWVNINRLGLGPYRYRRLDGIEYVNGRKVMVSHVSHDSWTYFWQPMMLSLLFGPENVGAFGQIPHLYPHVVQGPANPAFRSFLAAMHETFRLNSAAIPAGLNHFCRGAVIRHYYEKGDFSEIMNNRLWHTPGVFDDPEEPERNAGT